MPALGPWLDEPEPAPEGGAGVVDGVDEDDVGPDGGGVPGGVMVTPGIGPPEDGFGTTETTVPMTPGGWMAPSGVPGGTSMVTVTVAPLSNRTVTVLI